MNALKNYLNSYSQRWNKIDELVAEEDELPSVLESVRCEVAGGAGGSFEGAEGFGPDIFDYLRAFEHPPLHSLRHATVKPSKETPIFPVGPPVI